MAATQDGERRSGSRRFHRKSRNSCIPCRRRRVRCNLEPPVCANCHRRNETCSYQKTPESDITRFMNTHTTSSSNRLSDDAHDTRNRASLGYVNFDSNPQVLYDKASLYTRRQALTGSSPGPISWAVEKTFFLAWLSALEKRAFIREFDRQANAFQYVHQTIVALDALHEWCQRTPPRSGVYAAAAYEHHLEASMLFRNSQADVTEANWAATLMFGIGVIIFQFATVSKTAAAGASGDYLEMLRVLRSSASLAAQLAPFIHASPLMRFAGHYLSQRNLHLDESTWNAVCSLDSLDYPEDTADETRRACLQSIAALKEWVISVDGHPGNWHHFIQWPAAVSEQYLSALVRRHPVALVVFVYWCSIMRRSPKRWYMDGWANRAANVAMKHLGAEWNHVLEWPRSTLASEPGGAAESME
ncbi:hypothetical protein F4779DRAFT_126587 [Xylariaceae sp. FL0662B]|nr:hypothetical protein F4779DRAFT_126587 [Xylariaceae sp. FL0662B]